MAWLESLLSLLNSTLSGNAEHERLRMKYMINSEEIFDEMDYNKTGEVPLKNFARWVRDNCAYALSENDVRVLTPILDDARDGLITRDEFITAFSAPELDADLDEPLVTKKTIAAQPDKSISQEPAKPEVVPAKPEGTTVKPQATTVKPQATTVKPNPTVVKQK